MPSAEQDLDGVVTVSLGAKGVVELELVASGEKWGRGPGKDVHSSLKAMVDSPAWHLVKALDTLVSADGNTDHHRRLPDSARPLSEAEKRDGRRRRGQASQRGDRQEAARRAALDRRPAVADAPTSGWCRSPR